MAPQDHVPVYCHVNQAKRHISSLQVNCNNGWDLGGMKIPAPWSTQFFIVWLEKCIDSSLLVLRCLELLLPVNFCDAFMQ